MTSRHDDYPVGAIFVARFVQTFAKYQYTEAAEKAKYSEQHGQLFHINPCMPRTTATDMCSVRFCCRLRPFHDSGYITDRLIAFDFHKAGSCFPDIASTHCLMSLSVTSWIKLTA